MNDHDLHDQLERLGRRPVPPPRPEFVESLLARIQLTDDLREPAPVIYLRRKTWAGARVALAGAAAAVLLGAVGMLALARGGSDPATKLPVKMASETQQGISISAEVEDGRLVSDDSGLLNGVHTATCTEGGVLKYEGGSTTCEKGDKFTLEIVDGRIMTVEEPPRSAEEEPAEAETSTTVIEQQLELGSTELSSGDGVRLTWSASSAPAKSYVVVRKVGTSSQPLPAIESLQDGDRRQEVTEPGELGADETFAGLEETRPGKVAYRIFALDANDNVVARSLTLTLSLAWPPITGTGG